MTTLAEHVLNSYKARPCFICGDRGQFGACYHREFDGVAAIIDRIDELGYSATAEVMRLGEDPDFDG